MIKRLFGFGGRKLTPAELAEQKYLRNEERKQKERRHELQLYAREYEHGLVATLEQLGVCYRYKKNEGGLERVKRVRFSQVISNTEQFFFKVDTRAGAMPRGVGHKELSSPDVVATLSMVFSKPVHFKVSATGTWFIIDHAGTMAGIPRFVDYAQYLQTRPASASGLYLPMGQANGKKNVWRDLGAMPHMLIAGTTGTGKSNFINAALCTLLRHNGPRRLQLVLFDLKAGLELGPYTSVPHVWKVADDAGAELPAVVGQRAEVTEWLERLVKEGERRLKMIGERGYKNIGMHNSRNPTRPIPHMVAIFDEWADIKLLPGGEGRRAEELLINAASRFRAAGIHLVVCTQVPNAEVISTRLKTNLPARLAFAVPTTTASAIIIGDGSAKGLEPRGRAVLDWGLEKLELQTPRIPEREIETVIRQAVAGKVEALEANECTVTDDEIFEWALSANAGHLAYRDLHNQFRNRGMSQAWAIDFCERVEGEVVVVASSTYKVFEGAGNLPRRLMPYEVPLEPEELVQLVQLATPAPEDLATPEPAPELPAPTKRKRGRPPKVSK